MAVAVPVQGRGGGIVAAINVAGPMFRTRGRRRELVTLVRRAAQTISAELSLLENRAATP